MFWRVGSRRSSDDSWRAWAHEDMSKRDPAVSDAAESVKEFLANRIRSRPGGIPGFAMRSAARAAVRGVRYVGGGAAHVGRDAISGAVQAVEEVGGEASALVRDAVIGVIEGTHQVMAVTAPAVRDMVHGAIRSSEKAGTDAVEVGREVVEGAIVGAVSVGIESQQAAASAVSGAMEAMTEAGATTSEAVRATMGGVVSGATSVVSDVSEMSQAAAHAIVSRSGSDDDSAEAMVTVAGHAVDAAIAEVVENYDLDIDIVAATATGAVAAAYERSQAHGDEVRNTVLGRLSAHTPHLPPELATQVSHLRGRLTQELPKGKVAWRGRVLYRAARYVIDDGGIDLAASLAYFTVMSFFPMMALAAMVVALFGDPESVGEGLASLLAHYFPASEELIVQAIDQLFQGTLALGIVALVGTLIGANGLFLAANRAVNRLFGAETGGIFSATVSEAVLATGVVALFTITMLLTALFQVGLGFHDAVADWLGGAAVYLMWLLGVLSALIPAVMTGLLFTLVYHRVPNVPVQWRDAAYGGLVAMLLFEVSKHLFFWLSGVATQRSVVYGPVAAFVVLLMWAFISGLIFLYGAALTRSAGELRPMRGENRIPRGR